MAPMSGFRSQVEGDGSAQAARSVRVGSAKLTRYPPGLVQAGHAHDAAHASVLLVGAFREEDRHGSHRPLPGALGSRPRGHRHEVVFGPGGAIVLTLPGAPSSDPARWSPPADAAAVRRLIARALDAA